MIRSATRLRVPGPKSNRETAALQGKVLPIVRCLVESTSQFSEDKLACLVVVLPDASNYLIADVGRTRVNG